MKSVYLIVIFLSFNSLLCMEGHTLKKQLATQLSNGWSNNFAHGKESMRQWDEKLRMICMIDLRLFDNDKKLSEENKITQQRILQEELLIREAKKNIVNGICLFQLSIEYRLESITDIFIKLFEGYEELLKIKLDTLNPLIFENLKKEINKQKALTNTLLNKTPIVKKDNPKKRSRRRRPSKLSHEDIVRYAKRKAKERLGEDFCLIDGPEETGNPINVNYREWTERKRE